LWEAFQHLMKCINDDQYHPEIVRKENRTYFSITRLSHLGDDVNLFDSISTCLQTFFAGRAERDTVRQKASDLFRFVSNELDKNKKKVTKLEETHAKAHEADQYRLYGEVLTAYLHELKSGSDHASVPNYYEEETPLITIPLDPLHTPAEN